LTAPRAPDVFRLPDGRDVGLAEYGDPAGFPVLALHGTPASRLMFRRGDGPARRLGLRLIAPDRPGFGRTPPDETPTLASRTDFHAALVDALDLQRFAILGVSGGSPYAAALASRLGPRVAALALVSPMGPVADYAAAGEPPLPLLQRRFFLKLSQRHWLVSPAAALGVGAFRTAPRAFGRLFKTALGGPDKRLLSDGAVLDDLIGMTGEATRSGARGAVADFAIFGRPWGIDYPAVTAPTTIWIGTRDRVVPVPVAAFLARRIPAARLVTVPGAGHFWILEHAQEVLAALRGMIDPDANG
jgi:pimeloyl-ACP methyl ester carboxylesterase